MINKGLREHYEERGIQMQLLIEEREVGRKWRLAQNNDLPPLDDGTRAFKSFTYMLKRELVNVSGRKAVLNSHEHMLQFYDFPGNMFLKIADEGFKGLDDIDVAASGGLERADGIIVVLDPTILAVNYNSTDDYNAGRLNPESTKTDIDIKTLSQTQYAAMVSRLASLTKREAKGRVAGADQWIAICVNKIDMIPDINQADIDTIIESKFGDMMLEALDKLQKKFSAERLRTFKVSAVGYVDGQRNWHGRGLIDPDRWTPQYVEQPFLWILQQIETLHVVEAINQVRIFPRLPFIGSAWSNELVDLYAPYILDESAMRGMTE
jgi:hypothetical protein